MRKREKQELLERIKKLEQYNNALDNRFITLEKSLARVTVANYELEKAFDFAVDSNNKDLKLSVSRNDLTITLCYLIASRLVEVDTGFVWTEMHNVHILKNNDEFATIRRDIDDDITEYYVLNKARKSLTKTDKPAFVLEQELAEKKSAKKEKGSGNKKRTKGSEQTK